MFRLMTTAALLALAVCAGGYALRPRPKPRPDLAHIFRPARELTGKTPIIVIPGMLGSRLENQRTGEKVWPRAHPVEDDLSLPTSPDLKRNRDEVVATAVVETAKLGFPIPEIKVYEDLTETLTNHAGYESLHLRRRLRADAAGGAHRRGGRPGEDDLPPRQGEVKRHGADARRGRGTDA